MLPKGIIFDLDDKIIQFDTVAERTWMNVCQFFADTNSVPDSIDLYDSIRESRKWFWSDKKRHRGGRLNLDKTRKTIIKHAL
jgi:hypothetical protein